MNKPIAYLSGRKKTDLPGKYVFGWMTPGGSQGIRSSLKSYLHDHCAYDFYDTEPYSIIHFEKFSRELGGVHQGVLNKEDIITLRVTISESLPHTVNALLQGLSLESLARFNRMNVELAQLKSQYQNLRSEVVALRSELALWNGPSVSQIVERAHNQIAEVTEDQRRIYLQRASEKRVISKTREEIREQIDDFVNAEITHEPHHGSDR